MAWVDPRQFGQVKWGQGSDRPDAGTVPDGTVYIAVDEYKVYVHSNGEWVAVADLTAAIPWEDIINKPDTFPPEPHDLNGEAHTGTLPISRITGHTAFGPAAHQEAFAASVLRRP